jgi:hypothetical protein
MVRRLSEIIQLIGENAVRILFLCSYDKETLKVVENVIDNLSDIYDPKYDLQFEKKLMLILAKNVRIFEGRRGGEIYLIFAEKYRTYGKFLFLKTGK